MCQPADVEWADELMESESDKLDMVSLHDLGLVVEVVHNYISRVSHGFYKRV